MSTIVNLLRDDRLTLVHSLSKMNWDSLNYEAHMKPHKIGQCWKRIPNQAFYGANTLHNLQLDRLALENLFRCL